MLEIRLLGQFSLMLDARPVEIPSRPAQSLLAYLVLTAGIAHRRERLAGLLWPDMPESGARRNLRQALWHIRRALGRQALLRADDITIGFTAGSGVWVDVLAVEQKLNGERPAVEHLVEPVSAYGGELLPGFYDEWIIVARERLQAAFESRIKQLLDLLAAAGRWDEVVEWAERWIALAGVAELAYRALMLAYDAQGDLARVGYTYQRCAEALLRDLGVEPSEETQRLYFQLSHKPGPRSHLPKPQGALRDSGPASLETAGAPPVLALAPPQASPLQMPLIEMAGPAAEIDLLEEPPFKGMQFFDEADAERFFGREALTARLLERLGLTESEPAGGHAGSLLVIVGASGSGKSSLVRAGVAAALRKAAAGKSGEEMAGRTTAAWEIVVLNPAAHPLESLASALTWQDESVRAAAALLDDMAKEPRSLRLFLRRRPAPLFLIIDQLEEIFTLCREESESRAFVDNLLAAAEGERCRLLLTLRADFYAYCGRFEGLRAALAVSQEYIGPMSAVELRQAIEAPAHACGYIFEPGLVDLILRDAGSEPGALPLLSHALLETWKRRQGRTLTLAGYAAAGGVRGAIAQTAETVYNRLSSEQQRLARHIFLRLTQPSEGPGAGGLPAPDTRRRANPAELVLRAEDRGPVEHVLNLLAEARLVTISADSVEVAHEALIREWPALRAWLAEDVDGLRLHHRLTEAAFGWEALDREAGELYRGARLAQASEWAAAHPDTLNDLERQFLAASQVAAGLEAAEREAARQREVEAARRVAEAEQQRAEEQTRSAQRFRWLAAGLAMLLLLAVVLASFAMQQRNRVGAQARLATSRELAASSIGSLEVDPQRSLLLALQALHTADTQEAESALHQAVQRSRLLKVIRTQNQWAAGMVASPDGRELAVVSITRDYQFVTEIFDLSTGKPLRSLPGGLAANTWPDKRRLATVQQGADGKAVIQMWDTRTGELLSSLPREKRFPEEVVDGNFSPDWRLVAETYVDGTTSITQLDTGARLITLGKPAEGPPVRSVVQFSPDGTRLLAQVNHNLNIWDITTGRAVVPLPSSEFGLVAAAFSPKQFLVALGQGALVKLVDARTGQTLLTLSGHTGFIQALRFNADATLLATAGADSQAILWNTATGQPLLHLAGHTAALAGVAFLPGSDRLATSAYDGTVRIWDISPAGNSEGPSIASYFGKIYTSVGFSPNGGRLAVTGSAVAVEVLDAASSRRQLTLGGPTGGWQGSVAFSPDGARLATTSGENDAMVWEAQSGKKLLTLSGHSAWISDLAYSPDGKYLATLGFDGTARLWDAAAGNMLYTIQAFPERLDTTQVLGIDFSPAGSRFVTAAGLTPRIWDTATGKLVQALPVQPENVYAAAFSPDGQRLAIGIALGAGAGVWDLTTGKELVHLTGHQGSVQAVLFSRDGKQVITGSVDGTIKVWDAASGREQATLTRQAAQVTGLSLNPDSRRLVASFSDGTLRTFLLQMDDLVQYAQGRLTRGFTVEECQTYLHVEACPAGVTFTPSP